MYLVTSKQNHTAVLDFLTKDEKVYGIEIELIDDNKKQELLAKTAKLDEAKINTIAREEELYKDYILRVKPLFDEMHTKWRIPPEFNEPTDKPTFQEDLKKHIKSAQEIMKYDISLYEELYQSLESMNPPPSASEFLSNEKRILEFYRDNYKLTEKHLENLSKEGFLGHALDSLSIGLSAKRQNEEMDELKEKRSKYFQKAGIYAHDVPSSNQANTKNALENHWIKDENTGVYLWNPEPAEGESITWSGGYVSEGNYKYADGKGVVTWYRDGKIIQVDEGGFSRGRHHGKFTHRFPSGNVIYSNWDHGKEIE